mgnify:CR=1 FL=1|jgi:hypothetical protein
MERGSLEKLQYDKRLRLRNGWISEEETQRYIDALPDVSDKIAVEEEEGTEPETLDPSVEAPAGPVVDSVTVATVTVDPGVETPVDPLSPPPFREV